MDDSTRVVANHQDPASIASFFSAGQTTVSMSAEAAAALLATVPSSPDRHEAALKTDLIRALERYPVDRGSPAFLSRYRYWDPIYVPNEVAPEDPALRKRPGQVPLGLVCAGVAEIVDPGSIELGAPKRGTPMERFNNPAGRRRDMRDRIDGLLFPGSPIGLFESTDRIYELRTSHPMRAQHRSYALFSGTRSIEACISAERSNIIERWLQERLRTEPKVITAVGDALGGRPRVDRLIRSLHEAIGDGNSHSRRECLIRLLFKEIFPTPWSTSILYFSSDFFDELSEQEQLLVTAIAWKRMSMTCERAASAARDHSGLELVCAEIMAAARDAASGEGHCLVLADQCPEVLENTELAEIHQRYCKTSGRTYPYETTPLFVPGYVREPGDWGLICLRGYLSGMKAKDKKKLKHLIEDEIEGCSAGSYRLFYADSPSHVKPAGLPKSVEEAFKRERNGRKQRHKFLLPSIVVRRL